MKTVVVGTAGHIDHGKSALVRALTGINPDRLKDEQIRGITIDLGFAHATHGDVQLAFVDVPGHERFVRNMLAGAGGIDAVVLVVAATESVMPQTREHFDICRLLGVPRGVVALTKADLADAGMLARATRDTRELVAGSFLDGAPILPVSARTGQGLDALRQAVAALAGGAPRMGRTGVVRLPVDRVFTVKGFGVVVTGTLVSGAIAPGDTLAVLPRGDTVRVRGLQVHGATAAVVAAPQRVAVNLTGLDAADLQRGVTLATERSITVTNRVDAKIRLLAGARPLMHGTLVRVHHGTSEAFARVSIAATRRAPSEAWVPAQAGEARLVIQPGGEAFARLRLEQPAVLTRGDRLVIRTASPLATIGGAVVLDPEPASSGVRRGAAFAWYQQLDDADPDRVVAAFLAAAGGAGLEEAALVRRLGLDEPRAQQAKAAIVAAGQAVSAGGRVFPAAAAHAVRGRLLQELAGFHQNHPGEVGVPRETLRGRVRGRVHAELVARVLDDLAASGEVRGTERIALAGHQPIVSSADARVTASVEARLRKAALQPPDAGVIAEELKVPVAAVTRAIQALVREGRVARAGELAFHREALAALRESVTSLRAGQPHGARVTLDVAFFKARHGLTRKHAIPLLEWLDRERVTRRVGDVRVVL